MLGFLPNRFSSAASLARAAASWSGCGTTGYMLSAGFRSWRWRYWSGWLKPRAVVGPVEAPRTFCALPVEGARRRETRQAAKERRRGWTCIGASGEE